jgi:hypothetical protein
VLLGVRHGTTPISPTFIIVAMPPLVTAPDIGPVVPVVKLALVGDHGEEVVAEQRVGKGVGGVLVGPVGRLICGGSRIDVRAHVEL